MEENDVDAAMPDMQPGQPVGEPDMGGMHSSSGGAATREALVDLLPAGEATHRAVSNGAWSDPATWEGGRVPEDGAKVLIPEGVEVAYDVAPGAAPRLDIVRVDGLLDWSRSTSTEMLIDTLIASPDGHLRIGDADGPIPQGVTADIVITGGGALPLERADWDPDQLSRGIVTHGEVDIAGARKDGHATLEGEALAGADRLELDEPPVGWQVGDAIVLAGTGDGAAQNETLEITEILPSGDGGAVLRFVNRTEGAAEGIDMLLFDHELPDGFEDEGLELHVGNLSRNITVRSEVGPDGEIGERGHVMFMHNPDVEVRHAAFVDLGRTDKSRDLDNPGENADGSGTNAVGRYAVHIHRAGADDRTERAAEFEGLAVDGSPGWGIAHHDSHANLTDNFVHGVRGTGIAAEAGNEIGAWTDNLVMGTTAAVPDFLTPLLDPFTYNFGRRGEAYWAQGNAAAGIDMKDNVAAAGEGDGINIWGAIDNLNLARGAQDAETSRIDALGEDLQALEGAGVDGPLEDIPVGDAPASMEGFVAYNVEDGIEVWNTNKRVFNELMSDQGQGDLVNAHDIPSVIEGFTVWGAEQSGVEILYSSDVELRDGLLVGNEATDDQGVVLNNFTENMTLSGVRVEGFDRGVNLDPGDGATSLHKDEVWHRDQVRIEDGRFVDNDVDLDLTGEALSHTELVDTTFDAQDGPAPTAAFEARTDGSLIRVDATGDTGLAAYAWDVGDDGTIDGFGRDAVLSTGGIEAVDVRLVVTDAQGATGEVVRKIETDGTSADALAGVAFDRTEFDLDGQIRAGEEGAWRGTGFDGRADGIHLNLITDEEGERGIATAIASRGGHTGQGRLALDVEGRSGGDGVVNEVTVEVLGIDGQFGLDPTEADSDVRIGFYDQDERADTLASETVTLEDGESTLNLDVDFGAESYDWLAVRLTTPAGAFDVFQGDQLVLKGGSLTTGPIGERAAPDPVTEEPPAEAPGAAPIEVADEMAEEPEDIDLAQAIADGVGEIEAAIEAVVASFGGFATGGGEDDEPVDEVGPETAPGADPADPGAQAETFDGSFMA